jgi:hypothetical protein
MKLFASVLLAGMAMAVGQGEVAAVKSVYILPMSNSLDQFLAIRLTAGNVVQVVTDPKKADAILSDRIGAALDSKLDDLYVPKPPPPPKDSKNDMDLAGDPAKPIAQPGSHSRGAIFLIDRQTRNVIWSLYVLPKNTSPNELNHVAEKIAVKLSKDMKGK